MPPAHPSKVGVRCRRGRVILGIVDLAERVRRLATSAGDLSTVRAGLDRALRASVAFDIASISTVDPATMLWTSCFISGLSSDGAAEREQQILELEFSGEDVNGFAELNNGGRLVARLDHTTNGDLAKAARWVRLLSHFEITDEMRVVLTNRDLVWGTLALYRRAPKPPFTARDEAVLRSAVTAMADLFRLAMLRAAVGAPSGIERPPGMVVVSSDGAVDTISDEARAWLVAIDDRERIPSAIRSVAAAAAAGDGLARAAFPAPEGGWVMIHASPLTGAGGSGGVGIIIEAARPVTLTDVIAGAYGLTRREREITALAAQGRSTKHIAAMLGISPFTVKDHLKAVFAKVGVESRAELVATMYVQHYAPRRAAGSTPSPYGWYLDDDVHAAV